MERITLNYLYAGDTKNCWKYEYVGDIQQTAMPFNKVLYIAKKGRPEAAIGVQITAELVTQADMDEAEEPKLRVV